MKITDRLLLTDRGPANPEHLLSTNLQLSSEACRSSCRSQRCLIGAGYASVGFTLFWRPQTPGSEACQGLADAALGLSFAMRGALLR